MKREECVYGFPCVENPHNFSPDRECCTEAEVRYWTEAKERWDKGERDVRGSRCSTVNDDDGNMVAHLTATSWGIGFNNILIDDETGEFGEPDA